MVEIGRGREPLANARREPADPEEDGKPTREERAAIKEEPDAHLNERLRL